MFSLCLLSALHCLCLVSAQLGDFNSFDPIPSSVASQHFNIQSDTRRQTSSRVRFPDQDDQDLLLDVLPFPEERLALQQQSQTTLRRSRPTARPLQSSSRPLSLEDSFNGVRDGLKKPRLHLPRRNDQRSINRQPSVPRPREKSETVNPSGRKIIEESSSTNFVSKTKIITNPLLKKLFNRDRISVFRNENDNTILTTTIRPPPIRTTATTRRTTTVRAIQTRPTTRRTTTTNFPKTFTTTAASLPKLQPQVQQQQQPTTLFDRIKNRINEAKQAKQKAESPVVRKPTEEELMNALIQRRVEEELARRKEQERERIETERRRLLAEANRQQSEEKRTRLEALVTEAREAVNQRLASQTDKSSPAVWAAVRALGNFIRREGGDRAVPERVVTAVSQLVRFITEDTSISQEEEEGSLQEIQTFMQSEGRGVEAEADVILPNFDFKKLPRAQSDSDLQFPLLRQFGRELEEKKVTLNIPGSKIRPVPDSNSDIISTFRFSTLPV